MTCMACIHGMHKETKPTTIKKKQTREREIKMDDYFEARKNSFSHGIRTQNMNAHMMIIIS